MDKAEKPRLRAPGGGVKAADGVTDVVRMGVMVDPTNIELLKRIGDGNFSLGVREAARRLKESGDTAKFSKKRHEQR